MALRHRFMAVALAAGLAAAPSLPALAQNSTFGTDQHMCDRGALSNILSTSKGNLLGTAAGGALGGLLGNQIGKSSGNTVATIAGVLGGALAGGYIGRSMQPADQACVAQTLQHTPTGQSVAWHDQQSDKSYWVTPMRDYQGANGEPCRDYITQAVVNGQRQEQHETACRQSDGAWRTVAANGAPPPQAREGERPPPRREEAPPRRESAGQAAVSPRTVRQIQARLGEAGYYSGRVDGAWGPNTARALREFQRAKGLNPSGSLDVETMSALGLNGQQQEGRAGSERR